VQTLKIEGKLVYQVGLPFHWGYTGLAKGDIGNDLIAISEEPNVRIMESKGLLCNVLRGRRSQNEQAVKELREVREDS
jgi:formate dehydrogenase major subunit